ncbi:MAG: FeoC-like transcriptional regulator [bacterium]
MLSEIRRYMRESGTVSLYDLALHLDAQPDAVRGMLEQWTDRGRVRKVPVPECCRGCPTRCDPLRLELYEWIEGDA